MTDHIDFDAASEALFDSFPQEDLCYELAQYLRDDGPFGTFIQHPLVYSMMHVPPLNGRVNAQLRQKQEHLARAETAGEWHSYVFLHERPWRCHAFQQIARRLTDVEYWDLLSEIWIDSENIRQNQREWFRLLRSKRPGRENMMSAEERADLAAMPDQITVYQGHTRQRDDGWSWTTEYKTAEWFANRFAMFEKDVAIVTTGCVAKADVTAYLSRRGESEILVDRNKVIGKTARQAKTKEEQ